MTRLLRLLRPYRRFGAIWALLLALALPRGFAQQHAALVEGVDAIGITVSDMDRSVDFSSKVLTFERSGEVASAYRQAVSRYRPPRQSIVVWDTDASLKFYCDRLGMRVAGRSEDYGTEQEHLNNVFGAHLRITALRGTSGPGIELLEYLAPRDGRPFPSYEHANDIVHRQTVLLTKGADRAAHNLSAAQVNFVSSGVVVNHTEQFGFTKAVFVRDPDGHAVEVEEK
jgi:catechol 2,3-dioxygenase-like lactoylglutathione lyase family enzyme